VGRGLCSGELSILLLQHADCWGTMRNMQDISHVAWARMTQGLYPWAGGVNASTPSAKVLGSGSSLYRLSFPPPFCDYYIVPPQHRLVDPLRSSGREEWWGLAVVLSACWTGIWFSAEPRLHSSAVLAWLIAPDGNLPCGLKCRCKSIQVLQNADLSVRG
jgi:hypothetical protein